MKKIFNYALLAAALLVGVNVNAETISSYDGLKNAIEGADENATINLVVESDINGASTININKNQVVNLTIANHSNIIITAATQFCIIDKGELNIDGNGMIKCEQGSSSLFFVYGTKEENVSKYSTLTIGKDVTIYSHGEFDGRGIYVRPNKSFEGDDLKIANGAIVVINGTMDTKGGCIQTLGTASYVGRETQKPYAPQITLSSTGVLKISLDDFLYTDGSWFGANCIQANGYGYYNIHGTLIGNMGIYVKAGVLNIDGATITATGTYHEPERNGNGATAGGTGIVIDSHGSYGPIDGITISNTVISADNGYALEEVATLGDTKLPDLNIESGTFVGGLGSITTTEGERQHITEEGSVVGGDWYNSDMSQYINPNKNSIINFVDEDGVPYQVIVPIKEADWAQSIAAAKDSAEGKKYAYVKADEPVEENTTVEFVRIAKGKTVTVKSGAILDAGTLMTEGPSTDSPGGETGKIIVEAGGTLIVSGKQGAYTYNENSLVVKASQTTSGQILINPAVVLNTTPKATVEFVSNSCKVSDGVFIFQYFGIPMTNVTSVVSSDNTNMTYFDVNRAGTNWQTIGNITAGVVSMNYALFDTPFGFYQIQSNNKANEDPLQTYTFQGNLFGNTSPKLSFHSGWPGFSNAYMGITDFNALTKLLEEQGHDASVYVYTQIEGTNTLVWDPYNKYLAGEDVKPMNAFMLRNAGAAKQFDLDYTKLVWNPATGIEPNNAPRLTELSKVGIRVNAANGVYDQVTLLEGDIFTSDYDNGADAEKYMNSEMNLYVKGEKDLAIMASDNVENTYIAFNCKNAGRYTMTFNRLQGEGFVIVDTKTNAHIAMAEGTTYEFIADAGEDAYRFMIVRGAQAPTEMQKTNAAVKTTKALINNQIVISNGERFFNVLGTEVK